MPRDELAEVLWGGEPPATWEKALRVLMTKLRPLLEECGIDRSTGLTSAFGCYTLTLPADAWIDVHAASAAIGQAEAAFAAGDLDEARAQASTAVTLSRPTFLPGEDGPWVDEQRRDLRDVLVRALECLRDASLAAGESGDAVRYAAEITELEPFRESGYRALMQAHVAAGDPAEALRVYESCRRFLADELGAYPSAESEAIYLEILRSASGTSAGEVDRSEEADLEDESPPPPDDKPPRRSRRTAVALATCALLIAAFATAAELGLSSRDKRPVRILPNSLVRLDPETFKPTKVVPIGPKADLVVASGGYIWATHRILRYTNDSRIRNGGDRGLTRVDASTGEVRDVGGLAPCGITADPSGDVWVGNCYALGGGGNVMRVDKRTLKFKQTFRVPTVAGYFRGMAYDQGSLWVGGVTGDPHVVDRRLIQLDPRTGHRHTIQLKRAATSLTWSAGYGDLWITNCGQGSVSRLDVGTKVETPFELPTNNPCPVAVQGDSVWVGDWEGPYVTRLPAIGFGRPQRIRLHMKAHPAGVTQLAAGDGAIWATAPDAHGVFRIDLKTNRVRRIPLRYAPWGVAVAPDDGAIWVALRWRRTYKGS